MITKWRAKNFKSILDQELDLAPLTIFCGVNSSGKSSFLQTIAMLAQSSRSEHKSNISFKGDIVDLGNYDQLLNKNAGSINQDSYEIGINLELLMDNNEKTVTELCLRAGQNKKIVRVSSFYMKHVKDGTSDSFIKWREMNHPITYYTGYHKYDVKKIDKDGNEIYEELINEPKLDASSIEEVKSRILEKLSYVDRDDFNKLKKFDKDAIPILDFKNFHIVPYTIKFYLHETDEAFKIKEDHTYKLLEILTQLPPEPLNIDESIKYSEKIIYKSGLSKDIINNLLMLLSNPDDDYYKPNLFFPIFNYNYYFKNYVKTNLNNEEMFNINLADWFYVLSKLDKDEKENIIEGINKNKDNYGHNNILNYLNMEYVNENIPELSEDIELPSRLKKSRDHFYNYFNSKIEYLGPLREEPKGLYEAATNTAGDPKGANTIPEIHNAKDLQVANYISTEYFSESNKTSFLTLSMNKEVKFPVVFLEWLKYFSIADNFRTEKIDNDNYKLYLTCDGLDFELPQIGTGISQIIPIISKCLLSPPGSTIIIEQPESQMHPKIQAKLADFFIAMSLSGRQCLIETHSEYIIEQLRYRIINLTKIVKLHEKMKLYFVSKQDGISFFKDLEIDEAGAPESWPEDFFDVSHKQAYKTNKELIKNMETKYG